MNSGDLSALTPLKDSSFVFSLFGREYHIYGEQLISDEEASAIYEKLLTEIRESNASKSEDNNKAVGNTSSWKDDETQLLQWGVFSYAL